MIELRFAVTVLSILAISIAAYISSSTLTIDSVALLAVYSAIVHFPIWMFYVSGFRTPMLTWVGSIILVPGAVAVGLLTGADIDRSSTAGLGFAFLPYYICFPPLLLAYGVYKVCCRQDLR